MTIDSREERINICLLLIELPSLETYFTEKNALANVYPLEISNAKNERINETAVEKPKPIKT